jgi:hypothetical protein
MGDHMLVRTVPPGADRSTPHVSTIDDFMDADTVLRTDVMGVAG